MKNTSAQIRQAIGCGYEPHVIASTAWCPPLGDKGYQWAPPKVCAGYVCNLPEVIEVAIARVHWSKGHSRIAGEEMTEDVLNGALVLEGAYNDLQHWMLTPSKDGGGGR